MDNNPYSSPLSDAAEAASLWRAAAGLALRVCAVIAGLLATAMILAGSNWLWIEISRGILPSLSLALLTGGTLAGGACAALAWLARRVSGQISGLAAIGILVFTTIFSTASLVAIARMYP